MSTYRPLPAYGIGIQTILDRIGDPFTGFRPGVVTSRRKSLAHLAGLCHEAWRSRR